MTLTHLEKTPWPWFGGKSEAAPAVWSALGDVDHYVEPFAGSLAVLLRRPHPCNRTYRSETVNDLDGLLCNAWRSLQLDPETTAVAASWPVSEADLHARHLALVRWREENRLEHLMGDPTFHDPIMAGWWIWGTSCWIGSGFCSGRGAWTADADGRLYKQARAGAREPGVERTRPHINDNGRGVNRPQAREPGVERKRPHLSNDGRGVNRPQAREPGVERKRPHLSNDGGGVNRPQARESGVGDYHPMTMPEIRRWFGFLSARLRHVRILNGDWQRACTHGATHMLSVRKKHGCAGVFLDPPYSACERDARLYACDASGLSDDVRAWCIANDADPKLRIVLAGFDTEHAELEDRGWRVAEWYKKGFLRGGMANTNKIGGKTQQKRERLWLSPACLREDVDE